MDIYVMCTENGLVPMYDSDLDAKKKLKVGNKYKVTVSTPRNYEFFKKELKTKKIARKALTMIALCVIIIWHAGWRDVRVV